MCIITIQVMVQDKRRQSPWPWWLWNIWACIFFFLVGANKKYKIPGTFSLKVSWKKQKKKTKQKMIMMASGKFSTSGHIRFKKNKKKTNNNPKINFYIFIFFFFLNLKTFYFHKREKVLLPERRKITVFVSSYSQMFNFSRSCSFCFLFSLQLVFFQARGKDGHAPRNERSFPFSFSSSSSSTLC